MSTPAAAAPAWAPGRRIAALVSIGLGLAIGCGAAPASANQPGGYTASTNPSVPPAPGRAGRLADFSGSVWVYEQDRGEWIEGLRNRPLTTGDRVSTGTDARAEVRIGSTTLRIASRSEVEVQTLDDQRLTLHLHSGSMALRLRTRDWAEQVDITTPEVRLKPLQAGHFRIDRLDDVSFAGAWRGELLVDEASSFPIAAGQRMEFWRERGLRQQRWSSLPADALQGWAVGEDQREERTAFSRYVSPEMTGAEELDRHGRFERVPDHGVIWFPLQVTIGWAPYLFGKWTYVRHWGWVWVDNQPWGFAPFHYGRWVQWRGQWGWVPGAYAPRPVFAPAPRPPHEGRPHPPPMRHTPPGARPPPRPPWHSAQPSQPFQPVTRPPAQPVYPVHPAKPSEGRPPHRPADQPTEPPVTLPAPRGERPVSGQPREPDPVGQPERVERRERSDRVERGERVERHERPERTERADRFDRNTRPDRERPAATPQPMTLPPAFTAAPAAPSPGAVAPTPMPAPRVEPRPAEPPKVPRPDVREEARRRQPDARPDQPANQPANQPAKSERAERGERGERPQLR